MRIIEIAIFGVASLSAFLVGIGVAAPPHRVAPGTPLNHTLVLGAYRFAFLIEPYSETVEMSPQMAALHKVLALAGVPMTDMPGMAPARGADLGPIFATSGLHPAQDLAVALALLVIAWPRLPRPTLRPLSHVAVARMDISQWGAPALTGPPRG